MSIPPPIPPIADTDRYQSYTISASTSAIDLTFPIFGDGSDLEIRLNSALLTTGWTLVSKSGVALSNLPLPITDGQVQFSPALTSGTVEIWGAWHPRQLIVPTAAGISRRDINLLQATVIAAQRELYTRYHQLNAAFIALDPDAITQGVASAQAASAAANTAAQSATTALAQINASILAYIQALPTTRPSTAGLPWNNGGVVSIS